jgi:hypothetical protein
LTTPRQWRAVPSECSAVEMTAITVISTLRSKDPAFACVRVFARAPSVTSLPHDEGGVYLPGPVHIYIDAPRDRVG